MHPVIKREGFWGSIDWFNAHIFCACPNQEFPTSHLLVFLFRVKVRFVDIG
jgi:hypothetical protein